MGKKILIYAEGKSDVNFLGLWLCDWDYLKYFEIRNVNGKNKLQNNKGDIEEIINKKHNDYEDFLICFDADRDFEKSQQEIKNQLEGIEISDENIFLFPYNIKQRKENKQEEKEELETLLLLTIKPKHEKFENCFVCYETCFNNHFSSKDFKLSAKDKVYAYLRGLKLQDYYTKEFIFDKVITREGKVEDKDIFNRFKNLFDFNSLSLNPLKDFLKQQIAKLKK
ncbi:DUF3226 domain-containing protein [Helicobacter cetorum]|uniref:DUF4435 domain-containing protein n=1 Tax=Helicobacter cetorum (strain ATCC BAA-429 / MIT 00-7128) TaxID=182217 RepID=I0ELX8_HELC0|nr:DUF3226 domain-containing protein [Helicobacter cetorum]AFI03947.1 hypothetical protein HCW_03340 [Helicobacter cetorum MIT 00-7128]